MWTRDHGMAQKARWQVEEHGVGTVGPVSCSKRTNDTTLESKFNIKSMHNSETWGEWLYTKLRAFEVMLNVMFLVKRLVFCFIDLKQDCAAWALFAAHICTHAARVPEPYLPKSELSSICLDAPHSTAKLYRNKYVACGHRPTMHCHQNVTGILGGRLDLILPRCPVDDLSTLSWLDVHLLGRLHK